MATCPASHSVRRSLALPYLESLVWPRNVPDWMVARLIRQGRVGKKRHAVLRRFRRKRHQFSRKLFGHRPADRRAGSEIAQRVATRPFPFGHMLEDPPLFAV